MKKKLQIFLICISTIFIIASIVLAIVNYVVLPPNVSSSAIKYKFNHYNMLKLKSVTVDGERIIYEFSSLNKYFNKNYASKNKRKKSFLELYNAENDQNNEGLKYSPKEVEIISTITSNYLIVTIEQEENPDSVCGIR